MTVKLLNLLIKDDKKINNPLYSSGPYWQHKNKRTISQIKKKSLKNKIDPKITNRIWKNMIYSYIDYERRNFKKK